MKYSGLRTDYKFNLEEIASVWAMLPNGLCNLVISRSEKLRQLVRRERVADLVIGPLLRCLKAFPEDDHLRLCLEQRMAYLDGIDRNENSCLAYDPNAGSTTALLLLIDTFRKMRYEAEAKNDEILNEVIVDVQRISSEDIKERLGGSYFLHLTRTVVDMGTEQADRFDMLLSSFRVGYVERIADLLRQAGLKPCQFPRAIGNAIHNLDFIEHLSGDQLSPRRIGPKQMSVNVNREASTVTWKGISYEVPDEVATLFQFLLMQDGFVHYAKSRDTPDGNSVQEQVEILKGTRLDRLLAKLRKSRSTALLADLIISEQGKGISLARH